MKRLILISVLIIWSVKLNAAPIEFYITNTPDSISIFDSQNNLTAKVLWSANAINGQNDIIQVDVKSYYVIPPSTGGRNYSLSYPILMQPKNISTIKFNSLNIRMRIYADTSIFSLSELGEHIGAYKVNEEDSSYYRYVSWDIAGITNSYVEFYLDSISTNNLFLLSAVNILMGTINEGDLPELISDPVLVPRTKSVTLNEGVNFISTNYNGIEVNGNLTCIGTDTNPVNLDLWVETIGNDDSNFQNNDEKFKSIYTYCQRLLVKSSNASVSKSNFQNIHLSKYSIGNFNDISLDIFWCYDSKVKIKSANFNYGGMVESQRSVVIVEDSYFEYYNIETEHHDSFLLFKNNHINADAFLEPIQPLRCFIVFEGNKIVYAGEPGQNTNRVGISIWESNYAVIRYNIIEGFRSAIEVGYKNKALIYNNTTAYNGEGVAVYATPDTISVYNNIFFNYGTPIDLDYSTYAGGTNVTYVNNNLWYELGQYHPLINNPEDSSIVIGNEISIHSDPLFVDTIDYKLSENSLAIDEGASVIPSFSFNFEVLDTVISIQDSILITDYWGDGPDIGAVEYDPSAFVPQNKLSLPVIYSLYQNYPNPFNPSTTIRYEIPERSLVTIKVYDVLGNEVETLVNEEKQSGEFEVEFNANNLPSGIYFYRLKAGVFNETKKMILLK